MKKMFFLVLLALPALVHPVPAHADSAPLYFASAPTLSPDAQTLYFCYEGDIWKVAATGGQALRVTAMTGYEMRPRVSPDGKWLAFSSNEQGNNNVYVVPTVGGPIQQLTRHDASDMAVSWSADSKYVYFESNRYNNISTYRVSIQGGTPERLFEGYFNTIANLVENPRTGEFYFNESTESYSSPTRKGYKGDHNPDIKSWDPKQKKYTQLTQYNGKDIWPGVDKNGNLYWVSDEVNGVYNLHAWKDGKPQPLTHFNSAVLYPQVSFNGEKIVYVKDYRIEVYDVTSGKSSQPEIALASNSASQIEQLYAVQNNISDVAVSPDGKKLAYISRGRLFVSDAKGKFSTEMPTAVTERVLSAAWDKDNQHIYIIRTRGGWHNLFKIKADGKQPEKAVYTPDAIIRGLCASHDFKMLAFVTGSDKIEYLDAESGKVQTLANVDTWSHRSYTLSFSHNNEWLSFGAVNLFEEDLYACRISDKKLINLTNSASTESSPAWHPNGKYLYFVANPLSASFPRGGGGNQLYRMALDKYDTPFATEQFNQLFAATPAKKDSSAAKAGININPVDLHLRWESLARGGSQYGVQIFNLSGKVYLVYASNHEGGMKLYKQELLDFDQKPAEAVRGINSLGNYSFNGKDLFAVSGGKIFKVDLASGNSTDLAVMHSFSKSNADEFEQMFYEVWAQLAANFYDVNYHGVDWAAKRDYYAQFLPHLKSRADLRSLITDMLGELNSSHLGFSSSGQEERSAGRMMSLETGIRFQNTQPYLVESITAQTPADKKDIDIRKGDKLVAVNGLAVDEKENREAYFASARPQSEITLTFSRDGKNFDCTLHTFNSGGLRNALYTQWEEDCRQRVNQQTNNRVAYIHMRDMGVGALNSFLMEMHRDAVHKDALILDLRFNNGGNVHNEVLEFLMQKRYFTWSYRNQPEASHPNVTPADKPIVVLINERSLSDAEVTSNGIQSLGIAKLVGTETYRWIIFTSSASLVDGSSCRIPAWGCYNLKGEDMEKVGVAPDVYIKNTFEDRILGRDPQLDKAIEEIMKELKK